MSIIDRIILMLYTVCSAIISILFILMPFDRINFLSENNIVNFIGLIKNNYIYSVVGLAFLIVSIRFFSLAIKGNNSKEKESYLIRHTDYGEVKISSQTIVGLIESVANKFSGISSIRPGVNIEEGILSIYIKGEVLPEVNIPDVSTELQSQIKEHVEKCTGAQVNDIKVQITSVTTPARNVK